MSDSTHFVFLHERTFLKLIWLVLRRESVVVLDVNPHLPVIRDIIGFCYNWLIKLRIFDDPNSGLSNDEIQHSRIWSNSFPRMFSSLENSICDRFQFEKLDLVFSSSDALAIKHACTAYVDNTLRQIMRLRFFETMGERNQIKLWGIDRDTLGWYRSYFREEPKCQIAYETVPQPILNKCLGLMVLVATIWWSLFRIKFSTKSKNKCLLGIDFNGDDRYLNLVEEITDRPNEVVVIHRNTKLMRMGKKIFSDQLYRHEIQTNGCLIIPEYLENIRNTLQSIIRMTNFCQSFPNALVFEIAKLSFKRLIFKALFTQFQFHNFLARDDYNADHILRTDELRKNKSVSMGIAHGLPVPEAICGTWRYIDFDIYYTFGKHLYLKYYADTWSPQTLVKDAGSTFGMDRQQLEILKLQKPKNIVFFWATMPQDKKYFEMACETAHYFPDRTVFIKHKRSAYGIQHKSVSFEKPLDLPSNLVETSDSAYELMLNCSYAVSTPNSTVPAEAIQYGLATFVWNAKEVIDYSYYRDFPYLCVNSSKDVIDKISEIDSGGISYPTYQFSELINLSGTPIFDVIRQDLQGSTPD